MYEKNIFFYLLIGAITMLSVKSSNQISRSANYSDVTFGKHWGSLKVNCLKPVGDVAQRKRFTAALSLLPISEHTHLKEINIMKEFGSWFFAQSSSWV